MVGEPAQHACPEHSGADRLSLVADMLSNAVALLKQAMDEIKTEKGLSGDDGDAACAPDRNAQQSG